VARPEARLVDCQTERRNLVQNAPRLAQRVVLRLDETPTQTAHKGQAAARRVLLVSDLERSLAFQLKASGITGWEQA
jgi:hypothetical protein